MMFINISAVVYSHVYKLQALIAVIRLTQPSILCEIPKQVSFFGLSNVEMEDCSRLRYAWVKGMSWAIIRSIAAIS